jgi:hypothetical protein
MDSKRSYRDVLLNRYPGKVRPVLTTLSTNIISHVASFLCYFDVGSFRLTKKLFNDDLKDKHKFVDVVRKRLQGMVPDPDVFLLSLKKYNHYIVGSFVLQCMFGVEWPDSDIDVCMMATKKEESDNTSIFESDTDFEDMKNDGECIHGVAGFHQGCGVPIHEYFNYTDFFHDILLMKGPFYKEDEARNMEWDDIRLKNVRREMARITYNYEGKEGYPLLPVLARKYKFIKYRGLLDYVVIEKYTSVFEFFNKTLDFAFCGSLFDGEKLYIKDYDAVLNRTCTVKFYEIEFLKKDPGMYNEDNEIRFLKRLGERADKYKKRGFKVKFQDQEIRKKIKWYQLCHTNIFENMISNPYVMIKQEKEEFDEFDELENWVEECIQQELDSLPKKIGKKPANRFV